MTYLNDGGYTRFQNRKNKNNYVSQKWRYAIIVLFLCYVLSQKIPPGGHVIIIQLLIHLKLLGRHNLLSTSHNKMDNQ